MKGSILALTVILFSAPALSKDMGTIGPVFEIAEPNILETIYTRLGEMEAAGEFETMQADMEKTTRNYVNRPTPVGGILKATQDRLFEVDLSITVKRDLMDHTGRVFAKAGTTINPLHYSHFSQRIVVIDGDDPKQVEFALRDGNETDTVLVLINGAPLELMREHGRRFYFDQNSQIVDGFHIEHVPSEVFRDGAVMLVREIAVGD